MGEIEELLKQIRKDVDEVRAAGQEVVGAAALDAYLANLQETAPQTQAERDRQHESRLEEFKAQHASNLAHYAATVQWRVEMLKADLKRSRRRCSSMAAPRSRCSDS